MPSCESWPFMMRIFLLPKANIYFTSVFLSFRLLLWNRERGRTDWTKHFCKSGTGKEFQGGFVFPEEPPVWEVWASAEIHFPLDWGAGNTTQPDTVAVWGMCKTILLQYEVSSAARAPREREAFQKRCGQDPTCWGLQCQCIPGAFYLRGGWTRHPYQVRTSPTRGYSHHGQAKWDLTIWRDYSKQRNLFHPEWM